MIDHETNCFSSKWLQPWSLLMFGNNPVRPSVPGWKLRYHRKLVFPIFLPKRDIEDSSSQSSRTTSEKKNNAKEVPATLVFMVREIVPEINVCSQLTPQ